MATNLTVQDAIIFVSAYIKQQKMGVNNMQPGLGAAQIVLGKILGPPFVWRFNRATFSFAITLAGGTDYQESVPTMGRIETQWLTTAANAIMELGGAVSLPKVSTVRRPNKVAPVYDDNAGNITFRFNSVPDQNYTAWFDYQNKCPLLTSWGQPFGPVPDEFAYIFLTGMLTWAGMLVGDARIPIWEKWFLGSLLGAQDGLDEQAKAIFLGEWMAFARTVTRSQGAGQGGTTGRLT